MENEAQNEFEYLPIDGEKHWSSHDLGCSAALLSLGFNLLALDKENPQKVKFIFEWAEGIDESIKSYWDYGLMVDGQTYFNALKRLKNQIYSE